MIPSSEQTIPESQIKTSEFQVSVDSYFNTSTEFPFEIKVNPEKLRQLLIEMGIPKDKIDKVSISLKRNSKNNTNLGKYDFINRTIVIYPENIIKPLVTIANTGLRVNEIQETMNAIEGEKTSTFDARMLISAIKRWLPTSSPKLLKKRMNGIRENIEKLEPHSKKRLEKYLSNIHIPLSRKLAFLVKLSTIMTTNSFKTVISHETKHAEQWEGKNFSHKTHMTIGAVVNLSIPILGALVSLNNLFESPVGKSEAEILLGGIGPIIGSIMTMPIIYAMWYKSPFNKIEQNANNSELAFEPLWKNDSEIITITPKENFRQNINDRYQEERKNYKRDNLTTN
jgi:hypothetical protein